jgi:hypothetical protein
MQIEADTTDIFATLRELAPLSMWVGAVLGAVVSAAFLGTLSLVSGLRGLAPIRRLLGDFAKQDAACAIFVRSMFSDGNCYKSRLPDYSPPDTTNTVRKWRNISSVTSTSDMRAATHFTNLLGQAGKREGVSFHSIEADWGLWDTNVAAIGGSFKTDRIFEFANPPRVVIESGSGGFRVSSGELFDARSGNDHGLIYKVTNPATRRKCFMVIGLGSMGTEAASYYLRTKARYLGKLFGGRDFALVVHVRVDHGPEAASPRWFSPGLPQWRRAMHPVAWWRTLRYVGSPERQ